MPTELYLRVAAGGPHTAAIIPEHMAPTVCDMGVSFLSMDDLGLGSTLYFVSERKNASPYLQPFSVLMKTHLEQEIRQRLPCRIVPYCFSEPEPPNERKKITSGA